MPLNRSRVDPDIQPIALYLAVMLNRCFRCQAGREKSIPALVSGRPSCLSPPPLMGARADAPAVARRIRVRPFAAVPVLASPPVIRRLILYRVLHRGLPRYLPVHFVRA